MEDEDQSTAVSSVGTRRSGRTRRPATSYYRDSEEQLKEEARQRQVKELEEIDEDVVDGNGDEVDEDDEDDEDDDDEEREDDGEEVDEEEGSNDDENQEESEDENDEDFLGRQKNNRSGAVVGSKSKGKPTSLLRDKKSKVTPSRERQTKKVRIVVRPTSTTAIPRSGANNRGGLTRVRRNVAQSLTALSKRVLDDEERENPDTSLVTALLRPSVDLGALASSVVKIHNDGNPNAAQCALLQLLFRSIGGRRTSSDDDEEDDDVNSLSKKSSNRGTLLFDPTTVVLEDLGNDDWSRIVTELVEGMRRTPVDRVLLTASSFVLRDEDEDGNEPGMTGSATTAGQSHGVGRTEFARRYAALWEHLGTAALTEGGMAGSGGASLDTHLVREWALRLVELVSVGQPDVRAAATVAAVRLCRAVLRKTSALHAQRQRVKSHLKAATTTKGSGGAAKAEALRTRLSSLNKNHDDCIEGIVNQAIVEGVVIHRYRDSHPAIREIAIGALSDMTLLRPDLYLCDQYLKYFGWLLSDKDASVRRASLCALRRPASQTALSTKLSRVSQKFLPRIVECVRDVSPDVQAAAMELLLKMLQVGLLDEVEDEVGVWNRINARALATDASPQVRRTALHFVLEQLEAFDDDSANYSEKLVQQRVDALASWTAHTLVENDHYDPSDNVAGMIVPPDILNEAVDHVVNSLRSMPDHSRLVHGAHYWTALLLALEDDQNASTVDGLLAGPKVDVVKPQVLARMLATAARLEHQDYCDSGDDSADSKKKKGTAKTKSALLLHSKSQESFTAAILRKLSSLMEKFKGDSMVLACLTSLPSYMAPTYLGRSDVQSRCRNVMEALRKVYLQSPDEAVLKNIAKSLANLAKGEHNVHAPVAQQQVQVLTAELVSRIFGSLQHQSNLPQKTDGLQKDSNMDRQEEDTTTNSSGKRRRSARTDARQAKKVKGDHDKGSNPKVSLDTTQSQSTASSFSPTDDNDHEYVLHMNLVRFRILAKQHDILNDGSDDNDERCRTLVTELERGLSERLTVRRNNMELFRSASGGREHVTVAGSVREGLSVVLVLLAWRVRALQIQVLEREGKDEEESARKAPNEKKKDTKEEDDGDNDSDDYNNVDVDLLVDLRSTLVRLVELCFEHFLEAETDENEGAPPKAMVEFSNAVQLAAGITAGDLRTLLPKYWSNAHHPSFRALALTEDGKLIGGFVRYFRSQEERLRWNEELMEEDHGAVHELLLPIARSLATNWTLGNRREAGIVLSHISGSGQEAGKYISSLCKILKKTEPIRLLEAHMACLRHQYDDWIDNEPEDMENDHPTDAEMTAFEEAERRHTEMFQSLEQQAVRLSMSLGVGRLSDPRLVPALFSFMKEGLRFAFSNDEDGEEVLMLGSRLSFLTVLGKYLNWIRRNKKQKEELCRHVLEKEQALRDHPEFGDVHKDDLTILDSFKAALGMRVSSSSSSAASTSASSVSSFRGGLDSASEDGSTVASGDGASISSKNPPSTPPTTQCSVGTFETNPTTTTSTQQEIVEDSGTTIFGSRLSPSQSSVVSATSSRRSLSSRGSASVRSNKLSVTSSIRSDLSPLPEMERESTSPEPSSSDRRSATTSMSTSKSTLNHPRERSSKRPRELRDFPSPTSSAPLEDDDIHESQSLLQPSQPTDAFSRAGTLETMDSSSL